MEVIRNVAGGAVVVFVTVTENEFVAPRGGTPLSVTRIWNCELPTWVEVGVQVKTPVAGLIVAPVGAVTIENVRVFAGMSVSIAMLVTESVAPTAMVWLGGEKMDGGVFEVAPVTWMLKVFVSKRAAAPLSVTRMVTVWGPLAWLAPGVQINTPVLGLMVAPGGAASRENVSVCAGMSGSVA